MRDGYYIEYEGAHRYPIAKKRELHIQRGIFLTVLGITLMMSLLFPPSRHKLRGFLIPGDDAVTLHAVEEFTDSLRRGETTRDALAVFCRVVIENGK